MDALELRVDLLESQDPYFVRNQVALLRRHTKMPIVFTVRSDGQGGKFVRDTKEETEREMFALLSLAVRLACEFVDVEACWDETVRLQLLENKLSSKIIASYHCFHDRPSLESTRAFFEKCLAVGVTGEGAVLIGRGKSRGHAEPEKSKQGEDNSKEPPKARPQKQLVDVVKVVLFAYSPDDALLPRIVAEEMGVHQIAPVIALVAGEKGKLSRVLNRYMTPVTHPMLSSAAAPGTLPSPIIQVAYYQTQGNSLSRRFRRYGKLLVSDR